MAEAGDDILDHAYLLELSGWVGAAAHRLKGMAASLACCRLAQLCQTAQHDPTRALGDPELGARLVRELAAALDALARQFPPQP